MQYTHTTHPVQTRASQKPEESYAGARKDQGLTLATKADGIIIANPLLPLEGIWDILIINPALLRLSGQKSKPARKIPRVVP